MEFRTVVKANPSTSRITYHDPVMFIGSCFAIEMGKQFETGRMPVMVNPSGTVYNPVSVSNTLDIIISGKKFIVEDLYNYKDRWLSFSHYTDFSSEIPEELLEKINIRNSEAAKFLSVASFLFITFGTARIYRWKESGRIVSNCHKIPASEFSNELLTVSDVTSVWNDQLDRLMSAFPGLKVIFTVSPVRHWKDGAHENQVSKSVLFLAIEELLLHRSKPGYFPAYELVMDDLRDYRFYNQDMLHPSGEAVKYIWETFTESYFDPDTLKLWHELEGIAKAMFHRIKKDQSKEVVLFAERMISRIDNLSQRIPLLNLEEERNYFNNILKLSGKAAPPDKQG